MADPKGVKQTLVEEGTELRGSLTSSCPVLVRGRVEGEIQAPSLSVSLSGAVQGKAKVDELRSEGELAGEFDADVVQLSGRVRDATIIRAKSLEVKLTPQNGKMQVVFGECELDIGDAPRKAEVTAPKGDKDGAKKRGAKEAPAAAGNGASQPPGPSGTVPPPAGDEVTS
jgi:cytoskeletal protein CcmA (bactofilin family)